MVIVCRVLSIHILSIRIFFLLKGGVDHFFFFFLVVLEKKSYVTNSYIYFYVYTSKCRQFEGLSTGLFILTIPNHTIKLPAEAPHN